MKRTVTKALLLAVALAAFAPAGARAQASQAGANPQAYCQAVDLFGGGQLIAAPAAGQPKVPTLADMLKKTTDVNEIVGTLLDAYAPLKPADYDAIFAAVAEHVLGDNYFDAQRLSQIAALPDKYRGKIKSRADLDKAIYDLVQHLGDPSTAYMSAPDKLALEMKLSFQGVVFFGAHLLAQADGSFVVDTLVPGSTADIEGFHVGDKIVSLNGKALKGLSKSNAELAELFPAGNQVQVVSVQDGRTVDKSYMVQKVVPYKPKGAIFPQGIGYIRAPVSVDDKFTGAAIQALVGMEHNTPGGVAGFVFDLRYVQDASVDSLKALIALLIDRPLVLHAQKRQGRATVAITQTIAPEASNATAGYNAEQLALLHMLGTMPVVILVNGSTSSPAVQEIVQALKESRANLTVVGERTHGPGTETVAYQLPNCGIVTVATMRYTDAAGQPISVAGVSPDLSVEQPRASTDGDGQLAAAVAVIVDKTKDAPANLVRSQAPAMPSLGPPPPRATPPDDVDWQRLAHERFTAILQGLAVIALAMVAVLYLLVVAKPRSRRTGGGGKPPAGKKS